LSPHVAPQGLLRVMLANDAPSAVAWLHRMFKIDRADLRMVALVHGLEVQQLLNLANGVRLFPLAAAPDSPHLRQYTQERQHTFWSILEGGAGIALTIAVFDMGTVTASTGPSTAVNDSALNAILDVARAFTLTDRGTPVVGTSWLEFVDPELRVAEAYQMWM